MSWEPVVLDLSLLEGSDLKEAELVKISLSQQLNSDRGGAVLSSLVDFYLETTSSQAVALLSTVREQLHKVLLEKLNDALGKAATRLAALMLLGHLTRKQPSWVHLVTRCPLLASLLRCLKTDGDLVVLTTGVLVLVTLLPMIPQCGKQLVYDFFDVFGRLASWSLRNPAQVPVLQLLHLQGALYSLFHRLYGMFPVNFLSYLRLHYSMKENTDTFHRVVKPMLDHVRVHPELVTGTQDQELEPTRWKCFEVHDIVMECSRLSLDPLEASSEDLLYCSSSLLPSLPSLPVFERDSAGSHGPLQTLDLSWSPSSHCGLSTPPPEGHTTSTPGPVPSTPGSTHSTPEPTPHTTGSTHSILAPTSPTPGSTQSILGPAPPTPGSTHSTPDFTRSTQSLALSDVTCSSQATVSVNLPSSILQQEKQPIRAHQGHSNITLRQTPDDHAPSTPGPSYSATGQSYEALFELALPRVAPLFIANKTKEVLQRVELDHSPVSPLELLDQLKPVQDLLVLQGDHAHQQLLRSAMNKYMDRSSSGSLPLTTTIAPPAVSVEELSIELLLVQNQLHFERFKRQQHAMRNRRLLRRVIHTTALEEQANAMRAQLGVLEAEMHFLRESLEEEQRRFTELKLHSARTTSQLQRHIQDLSSIQQGALQDKARLQSELEQCRLQLKEQGVELQRANHEAHNAQHQLSQLSVKVSNGEELQQHLYLMNQQLLLLRESNRTMSQALSLSQSSANTEVMLLQGIVGNEVRRLEESEVKLKQALDSANHRAAELETQLTLKDQLIQDQKRLLEDYKAHSRSQLSASESRCVALRSITQTLQTEILQLYSQLQTQSNKSQDLNQDQNQDWGYSRPRPSASVSIANGPSADLQPLYSPPVESPLTVGSFLEQEARRLFGQTNHSLESEGRAELNERTNRSLELDETANECPEESGLEEEEAVVETNDNPETDGMSNRSMEEVGLEQEEGEEVQEEMLLAGSPPNESQSWAPIGRNGRSDPSHGDLTFAVRQRRLELSLMDYNETGPDC